MTPFHYKIEVRLAFLASNSEVSAQVYDKAALFFDSSTSLKFEYSKVLRAAQRLLGC